ncbi:asparagine synthase-related protein [Dyadobacter sp. Leaf189]|uniref:asparagine synthase-related protein n=1 Tax=Dyadobacter sp. Leaf189 TaxID=1736295 RepID=UPI00138F66A9|nr:asparagine synthase-related protein [Dyadobacter sp. Leaf189]
MHKPQSEILTPAEVDLPSENQYIEHPEHILHEFEWGIWFNEVTQTLHLKRDIFGTAPFYYLHVSNRFVAFSNSLVTLLQMESARAYLEVDKARILNYISYRRDQARSYTDRTFFENIRTVLPGHTAVINATEVNLERYLHFSPSKWNNITTIEELGQTFKKLLFKSVAKSLEGPTEPIGSHLSGGLDSSSLSTITNLLNPDAELHTLYLDTKTKYSDESDYASAVADKIGSIHHKVPPQTNDFALFSLYTSLYGHPECMVISPSAQGSLMKKAAELGCKSLLIGHDGDSVVGSGLELIRQTYAKRNWEELKSLIRLRIQYTSLTKNFPQWDAYNDDKKYELYKRSLVVEEFYRELRQLSVSQAASLLLTSSSQMNVSLWHFFKKGVSAFKNRLSRISGDNLPTSVATEYLSDTEMQSDSQETSNLLRGALPEQYKMGLDDVFNAQSIIASEQFFALGRHYNIVNLFPFYDKDLFEFCLSIPMRTKFGVGLGRQHFREAMKDLLPENVRTRPLKANFSIYGRQAALRLATQSKALMEKEDNPVWQYVEKSKFEECLSILFTEGLPDYKHSRSQFFVTRTISLAIWLNWLRENNLY